MPVAWPAANYHLTQKSCCLHPVFLHSPTTTQTISRRPRIQFPFPVPDGHRSNRTVQVQAGAFGQSFHCCSEAIRSGSQRPTAPCTQVTCCKGSGVHSQSMPAYLCSQLSVLNMRPDACYLAHL